MAKRKKKSLARRILKAAAWLVALVLLYNIVGGYLPFARTPALTDAASVEARAEEMLSDIDTADRALILETRLSALDERIRLMNQAREELIITTYDCRDGESTRDIMAVALDRAEAGVRVRVLMDGIAGAVMSLNGMFRAFAAHPNIEVRFYNPLRLFAAWKRMGRMHDKYVIADDTAYILGGRNMIDHFIGDYFSPSPSQDREALIYNAAHGTQRAGESSLFQVRDYFEGMWANPETSVYAPAVASAKLEAACAELRERCAGIRAAKPALFAPADYAGMTMETRGIWLVSNPTGIYAKEPVVFSTLCALMRNAREDIVIHSPYAVLNAGMRTALTDIAARTPVTLMVNAVENGDNFVASSDYLYHKAEVLAIGVRLLEYAGGDSYHGKSIAIDRDISVIGSYNLDLRSTYVDTELMLVIRGEAVNACLRENMAALHADCRQVIDAGTAIEPETVDIPPVPPLKAFALRLNGALMQLVRNLV